MRFLAGGPILPDHLLEARDSGDVVFLCGAGVSFPAGMPTFEGLATDVIYQLNPDSGSESARAFEPWRNGIPGEKRPLDVVFNLLTSEFGRDQVTRHVAERLAITGNPGATSWHHEIIGRLSTDQAGRPQVVTTNFDHLFDGSCPRQTFQNFTPPSLPDLRHGATFTGITYLHGRLATPGSFQSELVLTSADFGRAYLAKGWATEFVRALLQRYTVVLLGYKAEDPPMKYLLQGLNDDGAADRTKLFAFDRGPPDEIAAKWRDRPVTTLAYPGDGGDHTALWDTLAAWAERADDPRSWKSRIVDMARRGPRGVLAHERGMVAHLVRTQPGAKLFSLAEPPVTPEWLCVFDGHCRAAKPSSGYGPDNEVFDPLLVYGLDDDPPRLPENRRPVSPIHDDMLEWRPGDENPSETHRLHGRILEGFEPLPPRLSSLAHWIVKVSDSPIVAWWASRWNGLHPQLVRSLSYAIRHNKTMDEGARSLWNIIVECLERGNMSDEDMGWFAVRERIKQEGWTPNVLRAFQRVTEPRLTISGPYGLAESRPPVGSWIATKPGAISRIDVHYPSQHGELVDITDAVLPEVFAVIQQHMIRAVGMLHEVGKRWIRVPSCYPVPTSDDRYLDGLDWYFTWFSGLLGRMAHLQPRLVRAHVETWPDGRSVIFDKLRLYAWNQSGVFTSSEVATALLSLDDLVFWDSEHTREILFAIRDRWSDFGPDEWHQLFARILAGPTKRDYQSDEDHMAHRPRIAAGYATWLVSSGCDPAIGLTVQLTQLKASMEDWSDGWAQNLAEVRASGAYWIGTDEDPSALIDLPLSEISSKAIAGSTRDWAGHTEQRPFQGLVKAAPRRALAGLSYSGKRGDFPAGLWMTLIEHWPETTSHRLTTVMCRRLLRLPNAVIVEMKYTFGTWLRDRFPTVYELSPSLAMDVFDHLVTGLVSQGATGTDSGRGTVSVGGVEVEQSRRTLDHAINGPIGEATEGLWRILVKTERLQGAGLPAEFTTRMERLLAAPGEGSDHAVCILCQHTSWLEYIDPAWTSTRVLPWFNLAHPASEPAWNGLLWGPRLPTMPVWSSIKAHFLGLFPKMYDWHWEDQIAHHAHEWVVMSSMLSPPDYGGLTHDEARDTIRKMNEDGRRHLIWFLGRIGKDNEDGWPKLVVPFIKNAWPRDTALKTEVTSSAWISLLDDADNDFPSVLLAVRELLVPIRKSHYWLHRLSRTVVGHTPSSSLFPKQTLDLLSRIISDDPRCAPFDLAQVLDLIVEADPTLAAHAGMRRLHNLALMR